MAGIDYGCFSGDSEALEVYSVMAFKWRYLYLKWFKYYYLDCGYSTEQLRAWSSNSSHRAKYKAKLEGEVYSLVEKLGLDGVPPVLTGLPELSSYDNLTEIGDIVKRLKLRAYDASYRRYWLAHNLGHEDWSRVAQELWWELIQHLKYLFEIIEEKFSLVDLEA